MCHDMVWGSMVERYAVSLSIAGFSGTPSSLLPEDLGECLFEAENEGQHCGSEILSNSIWGGQGAERKTWQPDRQLPRACIEAVAICFSSCLTRRNLVGPEWRAACGSTTYPLGFWLVSRKHFDALRQSSGCYSRNRRIPFRCFAGAFQALGAWFLALFKLACPEHISASLRNMVAKSTDPLYHCLIDTGALVMGFTNEVAKLLLKLLPEDLFEPWAKSIKIWEILGQPYCIPTQAGQDQFQILCLCVIRMALPILMIATLQWWFCGMLWNQSLGIDLQTRADGTVQRMCGT